MNPGIPPNDARYFLNERPFLAGFLAALLITVPTLLVFRTYFLLLDDNLALFILKGTCIADAPSQFNLRENASLCLWLKGLYTRYPDFQWYTGFLVLSQFLSLWGILAAFQMGSYRFFRTFLFFTGFTALSVHWFCRLQWTITASWAAIGAFLLLAAAWRRGDGKFFPPTLGLAFVLALVSVLVRYPAPVLVGLASVPAVVYLGWRAEMTPARRWILGSLALTALFSLGAVAFDRAYYSGDPAWNDSMKLYVQHYELYDFRNPVYDERTKPLFDSIGWSEHDLYLQNNDYFIDPDFKDTDADTVGKLLKLNGYFPKFAFNKRSFDTVGTMFRGMGTQLLLLFLSALLPFLPGKAFRFAALNLVWTFLVLGFCLLYLKLPERVYLPCLFLQDVLAVFLAVPKKPGPRDAPPRTSWAFAARWVLLGLTIIFNAYIVTIVEYTRHQRETSHELELKAAVRDLNPRDSQLFVTWVNAFPFEYIGAFDDCAVYRNFHMVSLIWFQHTPTTRSMLGRFGVKNPFKDMVDNPNLFMICTPEQMDLGYRPYMKEKYGMEVGARIVFHSALFDVFSVFSQKATAP